VTDRENCWATGIFYLLLVTAGVSIGIGFLNMDPMLELAGWTIIWVIVGWITMIVRSEK